jgi:hypothetical protein
VSVTPVVRRNAGIRWSAWLASLLLILQLGCQAAAPVSPPPASQPPAAGAPAPAAVAAPAPAAREAPPAADRQPAAAAADRYDLQRDEARGGHTLARHVGRTDAELRERLRREPGISAASTYTDLATAEQVVAKTLARQRTRVDKWLARQGPRPNLALDYRGDGRETIGRSITRRNPQPALCRNAVVVLRWTGGRRFIVLTSYPEVSR